MDQDALRPAKASSFFRLSLGDLAFRLPQAMTLSFDINDPFDADFGRYGIGCPPSVARAVTKRKVEFLAGRRCALEALREQQCYLSDLPIGPDRAPVWPEGFLGSITHVEGLAAAVVMRSAELRGIGIDIERIAGDGALEAIRSTVLMDGERPVVNELASVLGEPAALTLVFSAKESFYKAVAKTVGRVFDFDAVEVVGIKDDRSLDLIVTADLSTDLTRGRRLQVSMNHLDTRTVMTACAW